ncbi:MAG: hypothetical protein INR70_17865, partial [Parafilimonas terrae]|nr:hypothetical protein [Parafilimonas terrae]
MPDDGPKPKRVRAPRRDSKPRTLGKTGRGNPYISWRPSRIGPDGILRNGVWNIIHKGKPHSTGCGAGADAERQALVALDDFKLALHVAATEAAGPKKNRLAADVLVAEVLDRYLASKAGTVARGNELAQRVETLLLWWGERTLDQVDSVSCAAYVASRVGTPWKTHARAGLDRDGN